MDLIRDSFVNGNLESLEEDTIKLVDAVEFS